ncbi:hypothetical protein PYW07_016423 [Mythimna separata]|uniref:Uncharacterized protein n=1 Tax=Mythimna separata TaxID=271217 RepID=A0AAD7YKK7_MYTSE|nr:hypothetical protein PYW07_016423 [Mythimna separata]
MDFLVILVLALYITHALTKSRSRKHKASSEEGSIENLLYYKDCQRNGKPEPMTKMPLMLEVLPTTTPAPPRQPDCPFPKMCCALTCGNECGGSPPASHMQANSPMLGPPYMSPANAASIRRGRINGVHPPNMKRKRNRPPLPLLPTRRDFSGFTKEKIKGLISKDDDIRKILKDLVRVTMQKVDLQDMINANQNGYGDVNTDLPMTYTTVEDDYVDDYVE